MHSVQCACFSLGQRTDCDDLSANVWWPSELSEEQLKEYYGTN